MTERIYALRKSPWQLLLAAVGLAALALPVLRQSNALAQPGASAKPPAYEVVSIRENKSLGSSSGDRFDAGVFSAENFTLEQLIFDAYYRTSASERGITPPDPIVGLPGWAQTARYNVEAKTDADTAAAMRGLPSLEMMRRHQPLLRATLAERFHLRTHYETRERPVYDLVIAKGGSKLRESSASEIGGLRTSNANWEGRSYPIEGLAFNLSGAVGRVVEDKTGLTGKYSFTLHWTPDDQQGSPDAGPTLFTALEEQLGLKLISDKAPVDVLVVDHIERPTEN